MENNICDGCNVRENWEHRCHGEGCSCNNPVCMVRQGRITWEQLMDIVNKDNEQYKESIEQEQR